MGPRSPFSLDINLLTNLDASLSVELFRRLLWAEAARVGVGRHLINVPQCINVGDGGLDAYTENMTPSADDVIPRGTTGYQIKAFDLGPMDCRKELHQGENSDRPLKPEITRLLSDGGTYVLVLFADFTETTAKGRKNPKTGKLERRRDAIRDEFSKHGHPDVEVRVYSANQLQGFIERFPALVAWRNPSIDNGLPYSTWSNALDVKWPRIFVPDAPRTSWTNAILTELASPADRTPVFRVTGLPGIGKTRLVYESLARDDIRNRVIYSRADQFRESTLFRTLQLDDQISAILVIDECDLGQHEELVRALAGRGPRLALITLYYDNRSSAPPTKTYHLEPLGEESMRQIVAAEGNELPSNVADRITRFADGFPRVAKLLIDSYLAGATSERDFLNIKDEDLMDRLLGGASGPGSDRFRKIRKVLSHVAIFEKLGYEEMAAEEAKWAANSAGIAWGEFVDIINEQKARGIVQGHFHIYVTPFMLRIHLIQVWWRDLGFSESAFRTFVSSIPDAFRAALLERFNEHIPYLSTTADGAEFVRSVLGEHGLFRDGRLLRTEFGADFFSKLADADPASAIEVLKNTVGTWDRATLLEFSVGRRQVVWALVKLAVWHEFFEDAARLLLILGAAENETWANNASGVFAGLFSPAWDQLSPTELPVLQRLPVFRSALSSERKEWLALALKASEQALNTGPFLPIPPPEPAVYRRQPELWKPKTYGEIHNYYRQILELLRARLDTLPADEQLQLARIVLNSIRGLCRISSLTAALLEIVTEIGQKNEPSRKLALEQIIQLLNYEGKSLPVETREAWEQLQGALTGTGFTAELKRYVGMNLVEDHFDEAGNYRDYALDKFRALAEFAVEHPEELDRELPWLVSDEAQNGFTLGYELGRVDQTLAHLGAILDSQRSLKNNASVFFTAGYIKAASEHDGALWDTLFDRLATDEVLVSFVPELVWRSTELSDVLARQVLKLIQVGKAPISSLRVFSMGNSLQLLSEQVIAAWIEWLLGVPDTNGAAIALDLFFAYYRMSDKKYPLPRDLTFALLSHSSFFESQQTRRHQLDAFNWAEIGQRYIEQHPDKGLALAAILLEHFGEDGSILDGLDTQPSRILGMVATRSPHEVWLMMAKYLGPPLDSRAFDLNHWLRGNFIFERGASGMLSVFSPDDVWAWVEDDVEKRAWYVASFLPPELHHDATRICWAREVLIRYGKRKDVRNNLMANFSTGGWWGSESKHHEEKRLQLLEFQKQEPNKVVKDWIDDYISVLDHSILRAKIEEDRETHSP